MEIVRFNLHSVNNTHCHTLRVSFGEGDTVTTEMYVIVHQSAIKPDSEMPVQRLSDHGLSTMCKWAGATQVTWTSTEPTIEITVGELIEVIIAMEWQLTTVTTFAYDPEFIVYAYNSVIPCARQLTYVLNVPPPYLVMPADGDLLSICHTYNKKMKPEWTIYPLSVATYDDDGTQRYRTLEDATSVMNNVWSQRAADVFALVVMMCDDFIMLGKPSGDGPIAL